MGQKNAQAGQAILAAGQLENRGASRRAVTLYERAQAEESKMPRTGLQPDGPLQIQGKSYETAITCSPRGG